MPKLEAPHIAKSESEIVFEICSVEFWLLQIVFDVLLSLQNFSVD